MPTVFTKKFSHIIRATGAVSLRCSLPSYRPEYISYHPPHYHHDKHSEYHRSGVEKIVHTPHCSPSVTSKLSYEQQGHHSHSRKYHKIITHCSGHIAVEQCVYCPLTATSGAIKACNHLRRATWHPPRRRRVESAIQCHHGHYSSHSNYRYDYTTTTSGSHRIYYRAIAIKAKGQVTNPSTKEMMTAHIAVFDAFSAPA